VEKIRVLIVDDERLSRQRLRRLLDAEADLEVLAECASGDEAAAVLAAGEVDLLFLDVQMPQMDGFQLLASLRGRQPVVVFVTAYDEYAVKAFDVHALDYLLKPFDPERFGQTLERARQEIEWRRGGRPASGVVPAFVRTHLPVKTAGRILFLRVDEIDWIEAADNYVRIHTVNGEDHLVRETLNTMQGRLDPGRFLRIHRSTIVNVSRIRELRPWFHGDYVVLLTNGRELTLSRSYRDRVLGSVGV
jgi:two-component system LytT family response regulator